MLMIFSISRCISYFKSRFIYFSFTNEKLNNKSLQFS